MKCDWSTDDWYSFVITYNSNNVTNFPRLFGD